MKWRRLPKGGNNMEKIIVSGDINLQQLTQLHISASVNEHAHAFFSGIIPAEASKEILKKGVKSITLCHENETRKLILFSGKIKKYKVKKERGISYIEAECISASVEFDKKKNCQSFQDMRMTYGDIFRQIAGDNKVILPIKGDSKKIPYPIIQYDESDWEFLKRMAGQLETVVVPDYCYIYPRVAVGTLNGKKHKNYKMDKLEIEKDFQPTDNRLSLKIQGELEMNLCDKISYSNIQFMVLKKEVWFSQGMLECRCWIGKESSQTVGSNFNTNLCGLRLPGKVEEASGIQLKLRLTIDKQNKEQVLFPYTYLPVTGNGMYAMPEIGSTAYLYFPDNNERNAFVIDCLPLEKTIEAVPDLRYLKTVEEKELELSLSEINLKTGSNEMRILDKTDISFRSGNQICIFAEGELLIKNGGISRLHARESVHMEYKSGNSNYIHVEGVECTVKTNKFRTSDLGCKVERLKKHNPMMTWRAAETAKNMMPKVMGAIPSSSVDGIGGKVLGGIPGYENGKMDIDILKVAGVKMGED